MKVFASLVLCSLLFSSALAAGEAPVAVATKKGNAAFDPTAQTIPEDKANYLVMIDAGSSGCRVRAFKYGTVSDKLVVQPVLKDGKQWEVKPDSVQPLHKVTTVGDDGKLGDAAAVDKAIKTLTDTVTNEIVPQAKRANTYVSLMATAGMRMLKGKQRNSILRQVRKALRDSGFKTVGRRTAYVLPGEDEGLFTWITINYLRDTLTTDNDEKIDYIHRSSDPTTKAQVHFKSTAIVEMGGASTQVAFVANNEPLAHSYHYNVDDLDLTLYDTSYMNFGNDEGRKNLIAGVKEAVEKAKEKAKADPKTPIPELVNPCGVTGVEMEGLPSKWNQDGCDAAIKKYSLMMNKKCTQQGCAFDGRYMPGIPTGQKIALVGAFTKAAQSLGCVDDADKIKCLGDHSVALCGAADKTKAVDMIQKTWKNSKFEEKFLAGTCFMARYAYLMLTEGLHFKAGATNIEFAEKVSNTNIGWEYGAAVFYVKMLERFERRRQTLVKLGFIPEGGNTGAPKPTTTPAPKPTTK